MKKEGIIMKKIKLGFGILLLMMITVGVNVFAENYTESSSTHRVYYRDNGKNYTTHYSIDSSGSQIYAVVAGYVNDISVYYPVYSGVSAPRVAELTKTIDTFHYHHHG